MEGITRAKRKITKPHIERTVDSYLWRLANRRDSPYVVAAILLGTLGAGIVLGWVL